MQKALHSVLVALALLIAATASGWSAAPSGLSGFAPNELALNGFAPNELALSGVASQHVTAHDPTAIEDDDGDHDDDDGSECIVVEPPRSADDDQEDADADADGDANALQPSARAPGIPPVIVAASSTTPWGLRPSGEHRHAADRPPRA